MDGVSVKGATVASAIFVTSVAAIYASDWRWVVEILALIPGITALILFVGVLDDRGNEGMFAKLQEVPPIKWVVYLALFGANLLVVKVLAASGAPSSKGLLTAFLLVTWLVCMGMFRSKVRSSG